MGCLGLEVVGNSLGDTGDWTGGGESGWADLMGLGSKAGGASLVGASMMDSERSGEVDRSEVDTRGSFSLLRR